MPNFPQNLTTSQEAPAILPLSGSELVRLVQGGVNVKAAVGQLTGTVTSVLAVKQGCRIATTTNIVPSGIQTLQGIALVDGDRVLVAGQTNPVNNAIYIVHTGPWALAPDFNTSSQIISGCMVSIAQGSSSGLVYVLTTPDPITLGTSPLTFVPLGFGGPPAQPLTGTEAVPAQQGGNEVLTTSQAIANLAFTGTGLAGLPAAAALTGADLFYGVQSGSDVKVTGTQITTLLATGGPGLSRTGNDFPKTNNTLANITGLSINVLASTSYMFRAELAIASGAGGVQAAISGTCTVNNIVYDGWVVDSAANGTKGNAQASALNGVVASVIPTGAAVHITIVGLIEVQNAGTLTVQFAQNTTNAAASTVKRGSSFLAFSVP